MSTLMTDDLAQRIANDFKGKTLDGCTIDDLHAKGGTSVILVGTKNGERVAIKIYAKELFDDTGAEEERLERQLEKKHLLHPNLVKTHGASCCPITHYHYLIMDFIEDPTLEECAHDLPHEQIRPVIHQLASAALFMHNDMEQVHRDIKPPNVAVRRGDYKVTLLDLGLVRPVSGATITDMGPRHIKGTKHYAPPELLDNKVQLTPEGWLAVTFYQLGATLYEMLTLKRPFGEYEGDDLLRAIREVSLTIDAPHAPPDLVKLALDCLHKKPEQRLALVDWRRFLNPPEPNTQLDELEELLGAMRKAEPTEEQFPKGAQEQLRLKRTYTEISHDVELAVRSFISGREFLFPNYQITRKEELESDKNSILAITLDYATTSGALALCAVITTEITDASSRACTCRLSTSQGDFVSPIDDERFRIIYQGAFVLDEFSKAIRKELASDLTTILRAAFNE